MGLGIMISFMLLIRFSVTAEYTQPLPTSIVVTEFTKPGSHPQQVHISIVGPDHMRITWIIEDKGAPSLDEYGKVADEMTSATGEKTRYRYLMCRSGSIHHVKIGPLEPDTLYLYCCSGACGMYSFKTPPSVSSC